MISVPKFLESIAVAQSGYIFDLRSQILTRALNPPNIHQDKMLHMKEFIDAAVSLGIGREDAYQLFDKVDKDRLGTVCMRDLLTFCVDSAAKHRPHPAVALQKVCFLMVSEKCD